jgi:hypothetical protein
MFRVNQLTGFGGGAGLTTARLSNQNLTDGVTSPTDAYAAYRLNSNGKAQSSTGIAGVFNDITGEWLGVGAASQFECRATLNSGSLFSGTTGSWLALSSTRTWECKYTINSPGSSAANLTIEIRRATGGVVVASCTVDLLAEVA